MNIIFLDIDGVILPKKSHMTKINLDFSKNVKKDDFSTSKKYLLNAKFSDSSIAILNRLCDITNSKIVIHSYWRRNFKDSVIKEKLIKEGIEEKYFHKNYACPRRMTSSKIHDIKFWLDDNKLKSGDEYSFIIIDDEFIDIDFLSENKRNILVNTSLDDGLTIKEYRIACGALGYEDSLYDVYQLSKEEYELVDKCFVRGSDMFKWLYESEDNSFLDVRATYISYDRCKAAAKLVYGVSSNDEGKKVIDDLYKKRSSKYFKYLEEINREEFEVIIYQISDIKKYNLDFNDFDNHPISVPCLLRFDKNHKHFYIYPPENCFNSVDYLLGYIEAEKNER